MERLPQLILAPITTDFGRLSVAVAATLRLRGAAIKELREVIALAESGRLTPIDTEFVPLDRIKEVHDRLKAGDVKGRIVVTP